jgi:plasmid stabilization system protein ParE
MPGFHLTPHALDDIDEISIYLQQEASDTIALRMRAKFFEHFDALAMHPGIGHRRRDLTSRPLRFFTVDPYLIAYREAEARIIILAVLHGARDVKRLLRSRSE